MFFVRDPGAMQCVEHCRHRARVGNERCGCVGGLCSHAGRQGGCVRRGLDLARAGNGEHSRCRRAGLRARGWLCARQKKSEGHQYEKPRIGHG